MLQDDFGEGRLVVGKVKGTKGDGKTGLWKKTKKLSKPFSVKIHHQKVFEIVLQKNYHFSPWLKNSRSFSATL